MPIAAPVRKGLKAQKIAQEKPQLSERDIAKLVGTNKGYVKKVLVKESRG